jgi:sialidase-1
MPSYRSLAILAALLLHTSAIAVERHSDEANVERLQLFSEQSDGFVVYRIPGIVVTAQGTVLAYCESRKFSVADRGEIEIHLRRSTDGGRTFSPAQQVAHLGERLPRNPNLPKQKRRKKLGGEDEQTVNNPVAIASHDGTVHLLYCVEYQRAFHIRSDDDGLTWSQPVEITSAFDRFRIDLDWQAIATGPGHAIETRAGRLVVPFWMATYQSQSPLRKAVGVIYSDDSGKTWQRGAIAVPGAGEPNVAELGDGRVLLTARNSSPQSRRLATYSRDGAIGWSEPEFVDDLLEPGCMAGIVSHPGSAKVSGPILLFSNPNTTQRAHKDRNDVTIKLSSDGGRTWPISRILQPGPSAYSDLAVLPDGTVLCFYESGDPDNPSKHRRPWAYSFLTLARFDLDWLITNEEQPR